DLPQFLDPDPEFLRIASLVQLETLDDLFRQRSARALGEKRVLAAQLHAAGEGRLGPAIASDPHVAGRNSDHFPVCSKERFARRKSRIDLDAERLRALAEPANDHPK